MFYITIDRERVGSEAAINITNDDGLVFLAWEVETTGPTRVVVGRNPEHRAPGHPLRAAWLETEGPVIATVRVPGTDTYVKEMLWQR